MNHGRVNHEPDHEIELAIFSAYIAHSLLPHPKNLWAKMFDQLTENCKLDKEQVRARSKKYIREAKLNE